MPRSLLDRLADHARAHPAAWAAAGAAGAGALAVWAVRHPPMRLGGWYRIRGTSTLTLESADDRALGPSPGTDADRFARAATLLRSDLVLRGFADVPVALAPDRLPGEWTLVGAWRGPGSAVLPPRPAFPGGIRVRSVEPAPSPYEADGDPLRMGLSLDAGLTAEEAHYLAFALRSDNDPAHLDAFGRSFFPDFPVAASQLLTKARNLRPSATRPSTARAEPYVALARRTEPVLTPEDAERAMFGTLQSRAVRIPSLRISPLRASASVAGGASVGASFLDLLVDAFDPVGILRENGKIVEGLWLEYHEWVPVEINIIEDILHGKNVLDSIGDEVSYSIVNQAKLVKAFGPFLAIVPGIGTGIAVALELGASIVLGEDLAEIAIDVVAAAIPGGPLVQDAFRTAAKAVLRTARGQPVDQVALGILRDEVKALLAAEFPDTPAIREWGLFAFDMGVAVAQGKRLQEVGFQVGYRLMGVGLRIAEDSRYAPMRLADVARRTAAFEAYQRASLVTGRDLLDLIVERELRQPLARKYGGRADELIRQQLMPVMRGILEHADLVGSAFELAGDVEQIKDVVACSAAATAGLAGCLDPSQIPDDMVWTALSLMRDVPGGALANWPALVRLLPRAPLEIPAKDIADALAKRSTPSSKSVVTSQARTTPVSRASRAPTTGATLTLRLTYEEERADARVRRDSWIRAYRAVESGGTDVHRLGVGPDGLAIVR